MIIFYYFFRNSHWVEFSQKLILYLWPGSPGLHSLHFKILHLSFERSFWRILILWMQSNIFSLIFDVEHVITLVLVELINILLNWINISVITDNDANTAGVMWLKLRLMLCSEMSGNWTEFKAQWFHQLGEVCTKVSKHPFSTLFMVYLNVNLNELPIIVLWCSQSLASALAQPRKMHI